MTHLGKYPDVVGSYQTALADREISTKGKLVKLFLTFLDTSRKSVISIVIGLRDGQLASESR
jgi:hypothetical protein